MKSAICRRGALSTLSRITVTALSFLTGCTIAAAHAGAPAPGAGAAITGSPASTENHLDLGRRYERGGFLTLARDEYQKAFELSPNDPSVYRFLALMDLQTERPKESVSVIDSAVKKFPSDSDVLLTAGYIYQNRRDYKQARLLLEKAAQLKPKSAETHACLADIYGRLHLYDKALQEADKALEFDGSLDLANYEKGAALVSLKRYREAISPLKMNFNKDPLEPRSTELYMEVLLHLHPQAEAFEVMLCRIPAVDGQQLASYKEGLRTFISTFPSLYEAAIVRADADLRKTPEAQAKVHFALGDTFDSLNMTQKAIEQYKSGLKIKPDFARGYLRLGFDQQSKLHDVCSAMDNYRQAYRIDKNDPQILLAYTETSKKIDRDLWLKFCCWLHNFSGASQP